MPRYPRYAFILCAVSCLLSPPGFAAAPAPNAPAPGYFRDPSIRGRTIVFTAEGDLWSVSTDGGQARRLTTDPREEAHAKISPDGTMVAFSASYEGPYEVYVMPVTGGLPKRLTYTGMWANAEGWTPDGKVLYATSAYSTLPSTQLATVDPGTTAHGVLPLSQAAEGSYDDTGKTLYFTRFAFQGSHTRRYKGGTAQNLWKYVSGAAEAVPLTADYSGTSKNPMWWRDRVYFLTDRDGTMNLWSMNGSGGDLKEITHHARYDIQSASLDDGRIVYRIGADLHLLDLRTLVDHLLSIRLSSDFDQTRERWITNPMAYLTAAHLSPDGSHVVLTSRGQVFVAPVKPGRLVEATRRQGVRYRSGRFSSDGKSLLVLSDQSGEAEFWRFPANGVGKPEQLSTGATVLRTDGIPSPDGKWIAYTDLNEVLWLFNVNQKKSTRISSSTHGGFYDLAWSPDSRWLSYVEATEAGLGQITLYRLSDGLKTPVTSDRYASYSPAWSPDGRWLYFLSDRHFSSLVGSPWGSDQPEPFFTNKTLIYQIPLQKNLRSPFLAPDELHAADTESSTTEHPATEPPTKPTTPVTPPGPVTPPNPATPPAPATPTPLTPPATTTPAPDANTAKPGGGIAPAAAAGGKAPVVQIDLDGIALRLRQVPVPPGNYGALAASDARIFWIDYPLEGPANLQSLEIKNEDAQVKTVLAGVADYELSQDNKHLLVRKGSDLYVFDASNAVPDLAKSHVDLSGWSFPIVPAEEWREMFVEAWRLERDYFYDPHLHGVDWPAVLQKYLPLVERVTDRAELSDLLGQMAGELSALHTFVEGGDYRGGGENVVQGSLGAELSRDETDGGYRIDRIYRTDPDLPDDLPPLARPEVNATEGDIILAVNGVDTLSVPDLSLLLENQAGNQVLLQIREVRDGKVREVIVTPISVGRASDLRYSEWEYNRRQRVENAGQGQIGYLHLRAMGGNDFAAWARSYYPIYRRQGLIIDVRHNGGGNIDSWLLEKLIRKAWFYWQPRVGQPDWNMPDAFRGHMVVLCDESTASDGEAFTLGFQKLGLGKVIGTRTWGGEIWLRADNTLVDDGIATAAEIGVYGPNGSWLIEGHGVDPDIVVDNLPHATFMGQDAQLDRAIAELQQEIKAHPVVTPPAPPYPDKAFPPRPRGAR